MDMDGYSVRNQVRVHCKKCNKHIDITIDIAHMEESHKCYYCGIVLLTQLKTEYDEHERW